MLENIRKYTILFIVAIVLIFVGLLFLEGNGRGLTGEPAILQTDEKKYFVADAQKAEQEINLLQNLGSFAQNTGDYLLLQDVFEFIGIMRGTGSEDPTFNTLVNQTTLEKAQAEFGIYPSLEEIEAFQTGTLFVDNEGVYDKEQYDTYKKTLKRYRLSLNDGNKAIGKLLAFRSLKSMLSTGLRTSEEVAKKLSVSNLQEFDISVLSLELETFKEKLDPSEDELKEYWEVNKGRYLHPPRRAITYLKATPDFDAILAEKKKADAPEKTPDELAGEAEMTPEEISEKEKARLDSIALTPQERKTAIDFLGSYIDEYIWTVIDSSSSSDLPLEKIVKDTDFIVKYPEDFVVKTAKAKTELLTTDLLPIPELPADILGSVRGLQETVEQTLEKAKPSKADALDALSSTLGIGTDSWLLYRVDKAEPATEKSFEEAKEDVQKDYLEDKSREALTTSLEEAREAVATALSENKEIEAIATELELELTTHDALTARSTLPAEPNVQEILALARKTPTGEASSTEIIKDRGLFTLVRARRFITNDQNKAAVNRAGQQADNTLSTALTGHYFQAAYDAVKPEVITK